MSIRTTPYVYTTMQQLFNDMYIPLMRQGERCMVGDQCAMRNEDGTKACAAGMLIPDDVFERFPGTVKAGYSSFCINQIVSKVSGVLPFEYSTSYESGGALGRAPSNLIGAMQHAHDSVLQTEDFRSVFGSRAAAVAKRFCLIVPEWEPKSEPKPVVIGAVAIPPKPKSIKRLKGKKYAASVYRRAATILETYQDRHVVGYGKPWATDGKQCFCAIAAVDMVLEADGCPLSPVANELNYHPETGRDPSTGEPLTGIDLYSTSEEAWNPVTKQAVGAFNDYIARSTAYKLGRQRRFSHGSWLMVEPEATEIVASELRKAAARLEHGGKLRSTKANGK